LRSFRIALTQSSYLIRKGCDCIDPPVYNKDDNEYENVDGLLDNRSMFTVGTDPVCPNPNCNGVAATDA